MMWPMLNMFRLSLFEWKGILEPQTFIGLKNYQRLFTSATIYIAVKNTLVYVFWGLPLVIFQALCWVIF